jgi:hypothetical protein
VNHNFRTKSMKKVNPPKKLKYSLALLLSMALVIKADARPAEAVVFERFSAYLIESIGTFLTAAGATAVQPVVTAALTLLPWLIIVLAGSIIIWQSYLGYQEYQRENYSGISKPIANIMVVLILVFLTDQLSALLVA